MSGWRDLVDDAEEHDRVPGPICHVRRFLERLGPEDARHVRDVLERREIGHTALALAIRKKDPKGPSAFSIGRHRRGDCNCDG